MDRLQFWSTKTNKDRIKILFLILILLLFLTGCNPDSGRMEYEIEYLSGNVITHMTDLSKPTPIEGSELQIYTEHIEGPDCILYIQDAEEEILYTADNAEVTNRGQVVDGELWVCAECWTSVHAKQFLDTRLESGVMYRIDVDSGEITFEEKLNENEFFLTIKNGRCYFYYRGKESEEKLFGLVTTPSQNAEIYYRDILNWKQKHPVYTFNYVEIPTESAEDAMGAGIYTLKFSVQTDEIAVTLYSHKFINEKWENLPDWSVNVPYD